MSILGEEDIIVRTQSGGSHDANGIWVGGPETTVNDKAAFIPAKKDRFDLDNMPQLASKNVAGAMKIYSESLYNFIKDDGTTQSDIIEQVSTGKRYSLFMLGNWKTQGLYTKHYKYLGLLEKPA